jgi:hypothetical protein
MAPDALPLPDRSRPTLLHGGAILYECETGEPTFYVSGSIDFAYVGGKPAYWIDGNYLHPYDKTKAKLYFNFDVQN